jgi:phosphoribosylamine---glycine ligase
MKIIIFGPAAGAPYLAKYLINCNGVEKVYVYDPHPIEPATDKFVPIYPAHTNTGLAKAEILETLKTIDVDLIIAVSLQFQLWPEFQDILKERKIPYLIPNSKVGMLEWSKITSKKLLKALNIPTPNYQSVPRNELYRRFFDIPRPWVLKYERDWRAGLQTVIITDENYEEEFKNIQTIGAKRFLNSMGEFTNQQFIIEEFVNGIREYSYHALCNATNWTYLGSARDYKKRYENDQGHNTTGMGSYSPVENVDPIVHSYVDKIIKSLKSEGINYVGFLYLGIMVLEDGTPAVLEINTRPGDPEFFTILPIIKNNVAELFYNAATNKELPQLEFTDDHAVSIRIVHKDFDLLDKEKFESPSLWPVYGGIDVSYNRDQGLMNSVITAVDSSRATASDRLYKFLKNKNMGDFRFRSDIGYLK